MQIDASPIEPGARFAIVVSRYHEAVTKRLLTGAMERLQAGGVKEQDIDVVWAPGAFELPILAQSAAQLGQYSAVICLGAVIRGETTHDQHINQAVANALMRIGLKMKTPVMFGLLTCETLDQAFARAGGTVGNKGEECASAALHCVSVIHKMRMR